MELSQRKNELETQVKSESSRFLLVSIGNDIFGIPIGSVREVIEYTRITQVPMCSDIIQGIINVRGSVVPVINAARRLSLDNHFNYDRYSCVVIYEVQPENSDEVMTLGILVSRVRSIESVQLTQLSSPPSFGANIPRKFIWQMAQVGNNFCTLLDMNVLLHVREINQAIKSSQDHYFLNYHSHNSHFHNENR